MDLNVIVAMQRASRGIGVGNSLPWHYPKDLRRFSKLTKGKGNNAIIMGRKTWESLPIRPLPGRKNIVLSRTIAGDDITLRGDELYFASLDAALSLCRSSSFDEVWVIGGESLYREVMGRNIVSSIYVTLIDEEIEGFDAFFPTIPGRFELVSHEALDDQGREIYYQIYRDRPNGEKSASVACPGSRPAIEAWFSSRKEDCQ